MGHGEPLGPTGQFETLPCAPARLDGYGSPDPLPSGRLRLQRAVLVSWRALRSVRASPQGSRTSSTCAPSAVSLRATSSLSDQEVVARGRLGCCWRVKLVRAIFRIPSGVQSGSGSAGERLVPDWHGAVVGLETVRRAIPRGSERKSVSLIDRPGGEPVWSRCSPALRQGPAPSCQPLWMLRQLAQPTPQSARAGTAVQVQQVAPLARLDGVQPLHPLQAEQEQTGEREQNGAHAKVARRREQLAGMGQQDGQGCQHFTAGHRGGRGRDTGLTHAPASQTGLHLPLCVMRCPSLRGLRVPLVALLTALRLGPDRPCVSLRWCALEFDTR